MGGNHFLVSLVSALKMAVRRSISTGDNGLSEIRAERISQLINYSIDRKLIGSYFDD